ncbi:MAG: PspA/IM30 family protein [Aggregatilineales bacterium]
MTRPIQRFLAQLKRGVDSLLEPAADPRTAFAYTYQHQRTLLNQVQGAIAELAASKSRLDAKAALVSQKLPRLSFQARQSLREGREDLARLSLRWYQIAAAELQTLEQQMREVTQEQQRLSLSEQRLAAQIEAFFAREEVISARYTTAEAQVRIHEALGGVSKELSDLGRALEQTEQKAEYMQARASAIDRLIEEGVLDAPEAMDTFENKTAECRIEAG